jgi:hypothetical protein
MKEQRIILSVVGQVLDGVDDNSLLTFIKMVNVELNNLIDEFDEVEYAPEIPNDFEVISDGQSSNMASNQVRPE